MEKQFNELKQSGRRCWSYYGSGEFFGFFMRDGVPMAIIRVDNDHSIRIIETQSLRLLDE